MEVTSSGINREGVGLAKRYYWLKLPDDWFRQKPIKKLRKIAGGDTYTIIYLKMMLKTVDNNGLFVFQSNDKR